MVGEGRAEATGSVVAALLALGAGGILIPVAVTGIPLIGPDNFIALKNVCLVTSAAAAAAAYAFGKRSGAVDVVAAMATLFVISSITSAVLSINRWDAALAVFVSASSAAIFITSRALACAGYRRPIQIIVVVAIAIVWLTALLEAYTSFSFSERMPGGLVGNRNRMAHATVLGLPMLCSLMLETTRGRLPVMGLLVGGSGIAITLSRSRGAWLAIGVMIAVFTIIEVLLRLRRKKYQPGIRRQATARSIFVALCLCGGCAIAVGVPNTLKWTDERPYKDSLLRIADYRNGTGAERVAEMRLATELVVARPLVGWGPGNWRTIVPAFTGQADEFKRFPQGEWIGIAAERGLLAFFLLLGIFLALGRAWVLQLRNGTDTRLAIGGLVTTAGIAAIGVVDPLLATPTGAFLVPLILACYAPRPAIWVRRIGRASQRRIAFATLGLGVTAIGAHGVDVAAVYVATAVSREGFGRSAVLSPYNYDVRIFSATRHLEDGDCGRALPHLAIAGHLRPFAREPSILALRCRVSLLR